MVHELFAHTPRHHQEQRLSVMGPRGQEVVSRGLRFDHFMNHTDRLLRFDAFNLSLGIIRQLAGLLVAVKRRDGNLEKQLRSAASSVSLNLAESQGRAGKDRVHLLRIALGSAEEVTACLYVAIAWGYLEEAHTQAIVADLIHLRGMLGKMTRP